MNRARTETLKIEIYTQDKVTTTITSPDADIYTGERQMRTNHTVKIDRDDLTATAQNCDFDLMTNKFILRQKVHVLLKHFDVGAGAKSPTAAPGTPAGRAAAPNLSRTAAPFSTPTPQPADENAAPADSNPPRNSDSLMDMPGAVGNNTNDGAIPAHARTLRHEVNPPFSLPGLLRRRRSARVWADSRRRHGGPFPLAILPRWGNAPGTTVIDSDDLHMDKGARTAIFTGNVVVTGTNMNMTCEEMTVFFYPGQQDRQHHRQGQRCHRPARPHHPLRAGAIFPHRGQIHSQPTIPIFSKTPGKSRRRRSPSYRTPGDDGDRKGAPRPLSRIPAERPLLLPCTPANTP